MRYQAQIITVQLAVEVAPSEAWKVGAITYIDVPKNFNVRRASIFLGDDLTGTIPLTTGGVNTSGDLHVNSFVQVAQNNYPVKFEAIEDKKIEQGFYLAVLDTNVGRGCVFQILFEGYLE